MKSTTLKTFIVIFSMALFSATVNAQSAAANTAASTKSGINNWVELKEFHQVMAQTFHPLEDGNYQPIRTRSGELFEKARLLSESKVPAEFNKPEMLQAIQELVKGSRMLNAMVENKATDEEISKSLTALHETFHKIVGLCQPGDKNEQHDHSDPNQKHN
jgi:hypothetical protein